MATCSECKIRFHPDELADSYLCPECAAALELHDLRKVIRYLEGHPHDTLLNIVAATGVPFVRVKKFIAGGQLDRRNVPRS